MRVENGAIVRWSEHYDRDLSPRFNLAAFFITLQSGFGLQNRERDNG